MYININIIMGFHKIIKESLKTTQLKKIRIKTDPSMVLGNVDFRDIAGYEGYILSEGLNSLKILVLNPEMTVADIPEEVIEYIATDSNCNMLEDFKVFAKSCLLREKNKKENDPAYANVDQCTCLEDVEVFLKQNGFTENELNLMYRNFIMNENV